MTETDGDAVDTEGFEEVIEHLLRVRASDFTGYKRPTLMRRTLRRMDAVGASTFHEYVDHLEVHPEEFGLLFDSLLINVTSFFRDRDAWDALRDEHLPALIAARDATAPIRVWSAGCSSGEEAYSLAMLLAEQLGEEQYARRVKIYGTDLDEDALSRARHATYPAKDVETVPEELRAKYLETAGDHVVFRHDLRRTLIFGRHDLLQDSPISRLDLLVCRNVLMYLNVESQARVLERFHFAVRDGGLLFLGKAETLQSSARLFRPVALQQRIFTRAGPRTGRDWMATGETAGDLAAPTTLNALRTAAFDAGPVPQAVLDADGIVVLLNRAVRDLYGLDDRDIGRPVQDLQLSYRPAELRLWLEQVASEVAPAAVRGAVWPGRNGDERHFDVHVTPLVAPEGELAGMTIAFVDVTGEAKLREEVEESAHELETAYEELQSTNEELETTNEELQSAVEELETTNEELQSTNEELETINEELQSTNEELQAMNDELRDRSQEVDRLNRFLEDVLGGLQRAVIVIDLDLRVQVWNAQAADLWGLRSDEVVGRPILELDIGLPLREMAGALLACAAGKAEGETLEVDAVNRRGRAITCDVGITPLRGPGGTRDGVVVVMEERNGGAGTDSG